MSNNHGWNIWLRPIFLAAMKAPALSKMHLGGFVIGAALKDSYAKVARPTKNDPNDIGLT
ncbi:MAG: hypothetical protein K2Q15_08670 [Burkholderiales bacterium]|nr:hypothetical protein [Burkholderiales bacterium]